MLQEIKTCKNCKQPFAIEPDDFAFYEKFGVQTPKMCPLCRAQHRLAFRNERTFYKRPCDRCKRNIVSMYSPNKPYPVWCHDCWFSDDWDASTYAKEYDPARPFFDQLNELWNAVPKVALIYVRSMNSEYTNISADSKNCYMIVESSNNENCIHCYWIQVCRDSVDLSFSHQTELSYESDDCYDSSRLRYCKGCHSCLDSYFLLNCRGCSNCIGSVNLRNKQYHIFNEPVSKTAYEQFLKEARLETCSGVEKLRARFEEFVKRQPHRYAEIVNASGCTGNYINNVRDSRHVFHSYDAEHNAYCVHVWRGAKDCMDCDTTGRGVEGNYNSLNAGLAAAHCITTSVCWGSAYARYSFYCHDCTNVFGSVGLRKKNYCVLNRQYPKAEYEALTGKIAAEMRARGAYGDFFPAQLSPFGYNEACVQEQFPLTKEQALAQGFTWEDHPRGTYGKETVSWENIPDSIHDAKEEVTKEIFACKECKKNFRVIPDELAFYKRLSIPLPRLCPDCRHTRRFSARGPNRSWKRTCLCEGQKAKNYINTAKHFHGDAPCPNEFETSYAPERPEIVYCEQCYNAEVA